MSLRVSAVGAYLSRASGMPYNMGRWLRANKSVKRYQRTQRGACNANVPPSRKLYTSGLRQGAPSNVVWNVPEFLPRGPFVLCCVVLCRDQ